MLSFFPELYDWSWFIPFVFRVFLVCYLMLSFIPILIKKGRAELVREERLGYYGFGIFLFILAMAFLFGYLTQIAGAVGFALSLFGLVFNKRNRVIASESKSFYILIGLVSLSLVFYGPGPFALDLPL